MLPVIGICVSAFASIGFISHLLRKAPEGWEDSRGFHFDAQAPADFPIRSALTRVAVLQSGIGHAASAALR